MGGYAWACAHATWRLSSVSTILLNKPRELRDFTLGLRVKNVKRIGRYVECIVASRSRKKFRFGNKVEK